MSGEVSIALLGILGTLVGTVLGWVLNNLSQKGKLNIYISSWKDEFMFNNKGYREPSINVAQTDSYVYKLSLNLYNNSGTTKIMRDIEVVFFANKTELNRSIPKDNSTRRSSRHTTFYDNVEPINIPSKTIIKIDLHGGYSGDALSFIWKVDRIFLRYKDEKNRIKVVSIKEEKYKYYFENHKDQGVE